MTSTFTITIEQGRIDKVITAHETTHTRSQVQKWLQDGLVTVNGQPTKANYKVASGDVIAISIPEAKPLEAIPEPIPLDIVYEDDQVIVVDKPQGMVVHPAPGHPDGTLVNGLLYHTDL
ncbi:putative RNA pseudouridine synthase YlyB, partial [Lacticaseibacillus paracasei subsp. paracasei Lpp70]